MLLAAGLRARLRGRGLLGRRLDGQFLLQFVALQEAKLDAQLQDGFLLLMDGLVQVGVFVLHSNKTNRRRLRNQIVHLWHYIDIKFILYCPSPKKTTPGTLH